jgi:spermidine/putrescine transport system ATP-binding protein
VLEPTNFAVRDGELLTVVGPSGSAKTTVLRLIGGFAEPSAGDIRFEGRSILATPINRRPFNTPVFARTCLLALEVAGITLLIGYPVAIWLVSLDGRRKLAFTLAFAVPLLTSGAALSVILAVVVLAVLWLAAVLGRSR